MADHDLAPTRIALLELTEDRRTADEGYALLDEKCMLLASRILALIARYEADWRRWRTDLAAAEAALRAAFERYGLGDLESRPVAPATLVLVRREQRVLGVGVPEVTGVRLEFGPEPAVFDDSAEARRATVLYRDLCRLAAPLAALECALWRLADEYRRTERRAGAIEHLLLPEIERDIAVIEAALETVDQEEAVRVRRAAGQGAADSRLLRSSTSA
ncbi:MAG TPA: V-type ATP synthase subunit D [Steroidobacteraceae bacterium]|nr:V-type ATP synthase subunit D [Steroidobacteraceae bacterium]